MGFIHIAPRFVFATGILDPMVMFCWAPEL